MRNKSYSLQSNLDSFTNVIYETILIQGKNLSSDKSYVIDPVAVIEYNSVLPLKVSTGHNLQGIGQWKEN